MQIDVSNGKKCSRKICCSEMSKINSNLYNYPYVGCKKNFSEKVSTFGTLYLCSYDRYKTIDGIKVVDNLMKNSFCSKNFSIKCTFCEL